MSKAEDRAKSLGYRKDPLNRAEYTANDEWDAFIDGYQEGYHHAEKDLELSWEDLKLLQDISHELFSEVANGSVDFYQIYPTEQSFLEEVLKRFKDFKERKQQ